MNVTGAAFFAVPESLLEQLRQRRADRRAQRGSKTAPGAAPKYLSTVDIVNSGAPLEQVTSLAQAFVQGMNDLQTEVEAQYDAFLLDPGMGPMTYLTADGRILLDNRTWDGEGVEPETSFDHAIMAIVCGAKKTGITDLLNLIPRLADGEVCPHCNGARWASLTPLHEHKMICQICFGRGEVDERLLARAREHGMLQAE